MEDYDNYIISFKWKIIYVLLAGAAIFGITYLFYRNSFLAGGLSPLGIFYLRHRRKQLVLRRKNQLNLQFKDLLTSLASSLSSGNAVENAFSNALGDLLVLYPGDDACIIRETRIILHKLALNVTIEEAVGDLARRSKLDDIVNFSDCISICKRSGGNLIVAVKNASGIISDKIEMKQEIETLLASRKFEQRILNIMPVVIISLLSVSAQDYISPLFMTNAGKAAMTVSLLLLAAAYLISGKIMSIRL
ncbi:hypothetical protein CLHUN_00900 [Ruminiclostridium hungatei]|uniref:Bacterial type II secretion system protein F domain protein n=1 Tax=Ruminiclostridium hungatei TaxID=48256 RepID=A0A1V4SQZ5_RUMHU|nr:pilus assembly protein TadB [Ruminiclostridium hungatei]OPX46274.1 hypothetical protein CLHUN_00900 [Ruminiclostridium hungatei]